MVVRFFAATLLVALLLVVCQVPNTLGASSCPGEQSQVYNISVYTWPNANSEASAGVAVGMYYEESADLVWALYNAFALAAFNTSKLAANSGPAWNAAYFRTNVFSGDLYNVQNLVVDSARDKIIISKDTGVIIFRKSTFLSYGLSGNDAALETLQNFAIADAECRGIALDTVMNDGSFWVACQQNIYKFASDTVGTPLYTFYRADKVPVNTKLWALTVDVANRKLWASVDNADDYNFYQFNILSNNLEYSTNLVMGAESRGLVYDPDFEELYAVKRPSAGLVRTKAYNPGFAFGLYNDYPFSRPNGMAAVRSQKAIYISDTPFRQNENASVEYNLIWIYKYQHTGCQCRSDSECDSGETCHVGICVSTPCSACQVGTPDGSCVGSTCISTSNSTSFDSQVTFDGPAPHHVLTPDEDPTKGLNVLFESLEEIPPQGGIPIQALVLLNQIYTIDGPKADAFSSENFDVSTSTSKGDITFHFSLLNSTHGANRTFGSVAFSQNANSIKWTVDISGWPFLSSANTLLLRVRLLSEDGSFLSATKIASGGAIDSWELKTRNTAITVNLFNFAMADGNSEVGITSQFLTDDTVLLLSFPSFSSNITYDPDFGVIVTPSDSGDGGSDPVLVIVLAVVIPVVVIPILALIAILVAVYLYTYFRRKSLRHRRDSVNTASFEYAAESAASGSM